MLLVLIFMTKFVQMNRASKAFISKQYLLIRREHLDEQLFVRFLEKHLFGVMRFLCHLPSVKVPMK